MNDLRKATLVILKKDNQILLAMKKRGFGTGKWNGVGGKPNPKERIEDAAIRETYEEIGVTPKTLEYVATLNFLFPEEKKEWSQSVLVYFCSEWEGEPTESDEMKPQWFKHEDIPFESMWPDDKWWLPRVLKGKKVRGYFYFDENQKMIDFDIVNID